MSDTAEPLSCESLLRLLSVGLPRHRNRRLEALLDRLGHSGAEAWLRARLRETGVERMLVVPAPVEELERLKADAREALLAADEESEAAAGAALTWYLAVALGLVHHGRCLTRAPREEVDASLELLADVLPADWAELALRAAGTPG